MAGGDDVSELQALAAGLDEASPAYAAVLADLADLLLAKGEADEAQQVLRKLQAVRSVQLAQEASTAAAGQPLPPQRGSLSDTAPGASALPAAAAAAAPSLLSRASSDWETAFDDAAAAAAPTPLPLLPPTAKEPRGPPAAQQQQRRPSRADAGCCTQGPATAAAPPLHSKTNSVGAASPAKGRSSSSSSKPGEPRSASTGHGACGRDPQGWDDEGGGSGGSSRDRASPKPGGAAAYGTGAGGVGPSSGCPHVVEVYGLTAATKTHHLEEFVEALCPQDGRPLPFVRWVDDGHALLVCPNAATATLFLESEQDLFQLRPFAMASQAARNTAGTELLPPRERPKTTTAVARRLLSHHLGLAQLRDKGAERQLAEQRRANKEAKKERVEKLAAAWDDD